MRPPLVHKSQSVLTDVGNNRHQINGAILSPSQQTPVLDVGVSHVVAYLGVVSALFNGILCFASVARGANAGAARKEVCKRRRVLLVDRHHAESKHEHVVDHTTSKRDPDFVQVPRKGWLERDVFALSSQYNT